MKKIILSFALLVFSLNQVSAINSDELINNFVEVVSLTTETYIIPDGYDLYIKEAVITLPTASTTDLIVSDSGSIMWQGTFTEGVNFGTYNLIFKDSLEIYNSGNKDAGVVYTGYIFKEGSILDINGVGILGKNGTIVPEYEFLRQEELFNFYQIELTFLLLFMIIIILKKFTFNKNKKDLLIIK